MPLTIPATKKQQIIYRQTLFLQSISHCAHINQCQLPPARNQNLTIDKQSFVNITTSACKQHQTIDKQSLVNMTATTSVTIELCTLSSLSLDLLSICACIIEARSQRCVQNANTPSTPSEPCSHSAVRRSLIAQRSQLGSSARAINISVFSFGHANFVDLLIAHGNWKLWNYIFCTYMRIATATQQQQQKQHCNSNCNTATTIATNASCQSWFCLLEL